jgi:hypothetical protein
VDDLGFAYSRAYATADLDIYQASPAWGNGSWAGGVVVDLNGLGFASSWDGNYCQSNHLTVVIDETIEAFVNEVLFCTQNDISFAMPSLLDYSTDGKNARVTAIKLFVDSQYHNITSNVTKYSLLDFEYNYNFTPSVIMNVTEGVSGDRIRFVLSLQHKLLPNGFDINMTTAVIGRLYEVHSLLISEPDVDNNTYTISGTVPKIPAGLYPVEINVVPFGIATTRSSGILSLPSFESKLIVDELSPYNVSSGVEGGVLRALIS